jgi:hypothetical protein
MKLGSLQRLYINTKCYENLSFFQTQVNYYLNQGKIVSMRLIAMNNCLQCTEYVYYKRLDKNYAEA